MLLILKDNEIHFYLSSDAPEATYASEVEADVQRTVHLLQFMQKEKEKKNSSKLCRIPQVHRKSFKEKRAYDTYKP